MRVCVVGHITHDYYQERIVPGGCAFYGARVYAALGAHVDLVTSWGEDFACSEWLAPMERVVSAVGERTTTFVNSYRADATRHQRVLAQAPPLSPTALPDGPYDVLHLAPVLDEIALEAWMPRARALRRAGAVKTIALAVQGFARAKVWTDDEYEVVHRPWMPSAELLEGIDMAFLSDEDLENQDHLVERLRAVIPTVVLTRGSQGSEVMTNAGTGLAGIYATEAADPTGAGDTFAATYVATSARGANLLDAARAAAAVASIVVEGEGPERLPDISPEALEERARGVTARFEAKP